MYLTRSATPAATTPQEVDPLLLALMGARTRDDLERQIVPALRRSLGLVGVALVLSDRDGKTPLVNGGPIASAHLWAAVKNNQLPRSVGMISLPEVGSHILFIPARGRSQSAIFAKLAALAPALSVGIKAILDFETLFRSAATDPLTTLCNGRVFDEMLTRELSAGRRYDRPLALLAIDLDGFQCINDVCDQAAANGVLVAVAGVLRASTRGSDLVARTHGNQFVVLMTSTNDLQAQAVAKRLLARIESLPSPHPGLWIAASVGIATAPPWPNDVATLRNRADRALYRAKRKAGSDGAFCEQAEHAA